MEEIINDAWRNGKYAKNDEANAENAKGYAKSTRRVS